jgi:thioredoxin-like negative regulator of GroEL
MEEEPALVEFYSPRCSYCVKFAPVFEDLEASLNGSRRLCKINIDEEKDLAAYYRVRSVPTTILLKRGTAAITCLGCLSKEQLLQMWDIAAPA